MTYTKYESIDLIRILTQYFWVSTCWDIKELKAEYEKGRY